MRFLAAFLVVAAVAGASASIRPLVPPMPGIVGTFPMPLPPVHIPEEAVEPRPLPEQEVDLHPFPMPLPPVVMPEEVELPAVSGPSQLPPLVQIVVNIVGEQEKEPEVDHVMPFPMPPMVVAPGFYPGDLLDSDPLSHKPAVQVSDRPAEVVIR